MQQISVNMFRCLGVLTVVAAAVLYVLNIPILFNEMNKVCDTCTVTITLQDELEEIGWTQIGYSLYLMFLSLSFALGNVVLGILIYLKRKRDLMALLVAVSLATFGFTLTITESFHIAIPSLAPFAIGISILANLLVGAIICYFPDFRTSPAWSHFLALAYFTVEILSHILPIEIQNLFWTDWSVTLQWIILLLMGATQIYRYFRRSTPLQRQQTKWPVFAFFLTVIFIIISVQFPSNILWGNLLGQTLYFLALSLIPISFAVAIIRYRLWSIDFLINRTILYLLLSGMLLTIYSFVIFILGSIFRVEGNTFVSLMGTVVVAVLVQPLHRRVQMVINRFMYGDRQDPYAALVRLGNEFEANSTPDFVLDVIVHSVRDALRLPYVSLVWPNGKIAAESGSPRRDSSHVDVLYQGERIAELVLEFRDKEDEWSKEDLQVINDLVRQAGPAIHAVRLTQELKRSRQSLVTAREDERRRLRRDLHDGLGPEIAAFSFRVATARHLLRNDPDQADSILLELQNEIRNAVDLIRQIVHNLRPPVLDEYGLGEAVGALVRTSQREDLRIKLNIPSPLPMFDAAVEVAAYRIIQEGLANITRHARASQVSLSLLLQEYKLIVIIEDNGIGLPSIRRPGVGLTSMRERVEELGGSFFMSGREEGGTLIRAELPNQNGGNTHAAIARSTS